MTNKKYGTLYIGVSSNLPQRGFQHRTKTGSDFCIRYGLNRLIYWQRCETIEQAIQREKTMKHWPRQWKLNAIQELNPEWRDLFDEINA